MFRRSFIAAVTLIFTLILAQPAQAQTQSPSPSADPQEGRVPPRIALVLDASGSMAETDVDGGTRMDAAKDAATGMVEDLDDDVELGLIAYGSEVDDSEPSNIEEGCEDITVLRSVGALDREATTEEIDGLEATGYTPIGNSLRTAADELGDDGPRSIVLVSDGIDTCAPPAVCDVAEDLAEGGVDLTIHTVGFKVDDDAQGELECIAEATGGTYSSADDSDELGSTLSALAQRVGQSYEAGGTEITLAEERSDGQFLGEGAYQTELPGPTTSGGDGEAGWFKLNIPEGYRALVSATVVSPSMDDVAQALDNDQRYFSVDAHGENASCNMTASSSYDSTTFGREAPAASVMQISPDDGCPADEWNLSLHRQGSDYTDELPVEILIGLEPIPEEGEQGPAADDFDRDDADLSALTEDYDVTDVDGGTSYGTAPEVEPGTYSGSLVPGETRFYKLPMDWGERPVAEATFNAKNADGTRRFKVEVATPMRQNTGVVMSTSLSSGSEVTQRHEDAY